MRAGGPSATAMIVAAGLVRRHADPATRDLVPAAAADMARRGLRSAGPLWRLVAGVAPTRAGGRMLDAIERALVPGLTLHHCLRKRWIEEAVLGTTLERVVIVGGGLDALGARLAARGRQVVEIDHPATQRIKSMAIGPAGGVELVPSDLAREWPGLGRFGESGPVAVVAEGVYMYLKLGRVRELLESARSDVASGSALVASFMEPDTRGRARFCRQSRGVDAWLNRRGEQIDWCLPRGEFATLLASCGWNVRRSAGAAELRGGSSVAGSMTAAEGECIILAVAR